MTLPVITADPGPIARLEHVKAQADTPSVVFQRLTDPDRNETLRDIARAWQIPAGPFVLWFTTEHLSLYDAAMRVKADQFAHESLDISDEQAEVTKKDGTTYDPDVGRDKLRVETRLKLASFLDRGRYGAAKDAGSGGITVIVDRSCGGTVAIEAPGGSKLTIAAGSTEASAIPAEKTLENVEII